MTGESTPGVHFLSNDNTAAGGTAAGTTSSSVDSDSTAKPQQCRPGTAYREKSMTADELGDEDERPTYRANLAKALAVTFWQTLAMSAGYKLVQDVLLFVNPQLLQLVLVMGRLGGGDLLVGDSGDIAGED